MFRPAKITHPVEANDGKPFDASKGFLTVRKTEDSCTNEDLELAQCIVIFQYAQALNPPIKVTQAVLEAMANNIGAKFKRRGESWFPQDGYDTCSIGWNGDSKRFEYASNFPLQIGDRIQADDCPLALQVLLGFTTEGVPANE
jgi:hypothetical protein